MCAKVDRGFRFSGANNDSPVQLNGVKGQTSSLKALSNQKCPLCPSFLNEGVFPTHQQFGQGWCCLAPLNPYPLSQGRGAREGGSYVEVSTEGAPEDFFKNEGSGTGDDAGDVSYIEGRTVRFCGFICSSFFCCTRQKWCVGFLCTPPNLIGSSLRL